MSLSWPNNPMSVDYEQHPSCSSNSGTHLTQEETQNGNQYVYQYGVYLCVPLVYIVVSHNMVYTNIYKWYCTFVYQYAVKPPTQTM